MAVGKFLPDNFHNKGGAPPNLSQAGPASCGYSTENAARSPALALPAGCLRFGRLRCLLHLCEHFADGFVVPGAALLPPSFQVVALLFQVGKEVWAAEHRAPGGKHRFHLFKHRPLFPVAFEEKLLVNQPAVHDARHHLPVTEHHAHVSVFLAAGLDTRASSRPPFSRGSWPRTSRALLATFVRAAPHTTATSDSPARSLLRPCFLL